MDSIITKTMAEIYLRQGHLQEAYEIFKALSERDPADKEIRRRLETLRQQLNPPHPLGLQPVYSREEKIHILERWLANIRSQRKK